MTELSLELKVFFASQRQAEIVFQALQPELKSEPAKKRSRTAIKVKNNSLLLSIKALDRTAARASLHGFLKLIITANDLLELGDVGGS